MRIKILCMGILVVVFGLSLELSSSAQQREKYVLTIVQQPESPIEIVEVGVAALDPPLILPWMRVKNRSNTPIVEYTLMVVMTPAKEAAQMSREWPFSAFHKDSPDVLVEEEILPPGEVRTIDRCSVLSHMNVKAANIPTAMNVVLSAPAGRHIYSQPVNSSSQPQRGDMGGVTCRS